MSARLLFGVVMLLGSSIAVGQTFTHGRDMVPGTTLHQYVSSEAHQYELASIGMRWDAELKLHESCKSQRFVRITAMVIYTPVELQADQAHPTRGLWQERFNLERCGESKRYNVLFAAQAGAKPRSAILYPGDSLATAQLFIDANKVAMVSMASLLPKQDDDKFCQRILVSDTKVVKAQHEVTMPGRGVVAGVWEERWTLTGCGGQSQIGVTFVPDGKGGTSFVFRMSPGPASQPAQ